MSNWLQCLIEWKISGELIAVEIAEALLLEDLPEILQQLNRLRDMGLTVSQYELGLGYSVLPYL